MKWDSRLSRRTFLGRTASALALSLLPAPLAALAAGPSLADRRLILHNLHTGERLERVYATGDRYDAHALSDVDRLLRDHRTGDVARIDPRLLDVLHAVAERLDVDPRFEIISGYRSPKTNASLRSRGRGVAKRSFHLQGRAVDVRLAGVDVDVLRRAARELGSGGVGYYPGPDFVHLDTGPVRSW